MTAPLVAFTIYGEPLPKERPRHGKGHTYTPQKTKDAEARVVAAFNAAYPMFEPSIEYLRLEADFYRKGKRGVDVDNLLKMLQDALNGHLYADDEQIAEPTPRRFYGAKDNARTEVRAWILERAA